MASIDLSLSGLASGFDWKTVVDQLTELERVPQRRLLAEQNLLSERNDAYGNITAQLSILKTRVEALSDATLFDSRTVNVGDATIANATATTSAALGSYELNITCLANTSVLRGGVNVGYRLSDFADVSEVHLDAAPFATTVKGGTFTVNGKQITISTDQTLQEVFDNIAVATNGEVSASYDPNTDKITLAGTASIMLGSATDTSNFLQVAKLYNQDGNPSSISSAGTLGAVKLSSVLSEANFASLISDGGAGAGEFKINGVSITYNASQDSVTDVLARINNSAAGVVATYDSINDRFQLTNKVTGDLGVATEDITGNFLTVSGLASGQLNRGKDLRFTINGGDELRSHSNTITEDTSGIAGLTVTSLKEGSTRVEVASDAATIKKAISDFITDYNKVQSLIDTNTASSTDAEGVVSSGSLAGENEAFEIRSKLRSLVNSSVSGLSGVIKRLEDLGISSTGDNDQITLVDEADLDSALADNLNEIKILFSDATNGMAVRLAQYLDQQVGEDGALISRQTKISKEIAAIDSQINVQERYVQSVREQLLNSFYAMEEAQSQINQQLAFLNKTFGTT